MGVDSRLLEKLVCPRDLSHLGERDGWLGCAHGHRYPIVEGVPVMLLDGIEQTIPVANESLEASVQEASDPLYLNSVGLSARERAEIALLAKPSGVIDPVVSYLVGATNGIAYRHLLGRLGSYPIPRLRLPEGEGASFLDVGCNWGRWCLAAARKGYRPVGIDPSLGAVMAAKRVARQLGVDALFVVGDARHLPFRTGAFDSIFSYSVIQHFDRRDAFRAVSEIGRCLRQGGASLVQMPTRFGVRCLYHQWRRGFKEGTAFDVRYYSVSTLREIFSAAIGGSRVSVDCFFGIGLQPSDWGMMPLKVKAAIAASELLRGLSRIFAPLKFVADSVYIESRKPV
jgi:SAM-dependent methyltransferase